MTGTPSTLAELLADCDAHGIRLALADGDGLEIDAPQDALTPDLLGRLKANKADLLRMLARGPAQPASTADADGRPWQCRGAWWDWVFANDATPNPPKPTKPVCRCGSITWREVPIHGGESVRRDCGRCGRFLGFPIWYGMDTLRNEQQ